MADGTPGDDDVEALAAVWGREASARAPASPRPDLEGLVGGRPAPAPAAPPRPARRRRLVLIPGVFVVAVTVAVAAVRLVADDDEGATPASTTTTTTAVTTTGPVPAPAPPLWTAAVVCPRFEDDSGGGLIECPLATDDERAYVLVEAGATMRVRALDATTGQVRWEQAFPEGARTVRRLPSLVAVSGVGMTDPAPWPPDRGETVALDPVTGDRLWTRPGQVSSVVGRDHLVVDHEIAGGGSTISTMAVVEAATGREVTTRTGRSEDLFVHACGRGTIVVSEGDRLTGHDVVDGALRWSVEATHLDLYRPLACDDRWVAFVQGARLRLLDVGSGAEIGSVAVPGADRPETPEVRALAGDTVVVGSFAATRGYRADAGLELLWELPCPSCAPRGAAAGPAGDDVVVLLRGEAVVRSGVDGRPGPVLDLSGMAETVLEDGVLLSWGRDELVVADPADLGRAVRIEVDGVRSAAAGSAQVVVATEDEVRAYPREG